MAKPGHAEIAGAGFAGLTAAIALRQRGWTVRVHEASPVLRAFGAGIFIWENGLRVLGAVDAYHDVITGSHQGEVLETRLNGVTATRQRFGREYGTRMVTLTRQHLYDAVLAAAQRAGVEIFTGSEAVGAEPAGILHTADGRSHRADLVIGADGVKSCVRDSLGFAMQREVYQDGVIRLLAPWRRDALGEGDWHHVIDFWNLEANKPLRILYVPCNERDVYLCFMSPRANVEASRVPVRKQLWATAFPQIAPIISGIAEHGRYDFYELARLERWWIGKVALVGDSAHSMPPTLGQGAGCALMNAIGLAVALEEAATVEQALDLWERRERPLTDHTQALAADLARSRKLAEGHGWDDEALRAARHVPTGCRVDAARVAAPGAT
ncbi:MAG TPA: NAD(P)/FAD-dependent oxidoreductase [Aestuariivirgaceae bacterium]|nr:NAD(P)/FAD-dependent oxidoreductase [Aestuariivirgaceae bacterium]